MNRTTFAPVSSGSKNDARGVPLRFLSLCRGSLATFVPTKVVGLEHQFAWSTLIGPQTCGGTAVLGEATTATATRIAPGNNASLSNRTNRSTSTENTN